MATKTLVGLDIGSASVRAVETQRGKTGQVVTAFGYAPLPPGAVQGGVVNDEEAVVGELKRLWSSSGLRGRAVVLGVTNRQLVVREMSLPNLPVPELKQSLALHVRQVLPLPVERSLLDFYPLEDKPTGANVRGLLIAAPKEPVLAAVRASEKAGLHVAKVDLASFALLRAVSHLDDEVEAIADIGASATTVVVHAGGEPLIVRTIPRGGADITSLLATRLGVPEAEAEALKCQVGLGGLAGVAADRSASVGAVGSAGSAGSAASAGSAGSAGSAVNTGKAGPTPLVVPGAPATMGGAPASAAAPVAGGAAPVTATPQAGGASRCTLRCGRSTGPCPRSLAECGRTVEAIRDAVRPLINEIRSSFAYLTSGGQRTRVVRLTVSGGGAALPGLTEVFTAELNVPVTVADPMLRLRDDRRGVPEELDRHRSSAAVSIGLALGVGR